ncbi:MAG: arylsulfatase [Isosphaeraceae bacterium]
MRSWGRQLIGIVAVAGLAGIDPGARGGEPAPPPNLVVILADDLGYGDVSCYNPASKIRTPRIDELAAQGMRFTDAHSGSAVCTPTRYGLLTGRYAWRTRLARGVLSGYSPHLIEPRRLTLASMLRRNGYQTAVVGKWHLGLDWVKSGSVALGDDFVARVDLDPPVDYREKVANGPTALGFEESYILSASLDMPPYVFLRNDRCEVVPTAERTYIRRGRAAPEFEAVDVLPALEREAVAFLDRQARPQGQGPPRPFFLYLPLTAPHTPITPATAYRKTSGIGDYGDFVVQVDATIGRVLDALKRNHQDENTLVIVTSDNGCSPAAGWDDLLRQGHHPSGPFRGHKADIFEGGHRVPFVARWPGHVPPGTTCAHPICLTDLTATAAALIGKPLPPEAGEDSISILPDLLGQATSPLREATVHHSINGSFAIRQGPWKLALTPDSGGWSAPRPGTPAARDPALPAVQLYNLDDDPGERTNLQAQHPEIVSRLTAVLERYVAEGRSTPGPKQKNDRNIVIRQPRAPR